MPKNAPATRTLIVVPEDTVLPVLGLVTMATRSVDVKQFTLDEPRIIQALLDAHRRGVAVRVMLNPHRSSGSRANDDTLAALEQAQVAVQWTNPAFAVTHEKSMVVDGERALVATFNFSEKYFTQTRDYGIVTTDPAQVAQIAQGFEADWARAPFAPDEHAGLLWSTTNSRRIMSHFIDGAKKSLFVQHPKFVDATVLGAAGGGAGPRRPREGAVRRQARDQRHRHPRHLLVAAHPRAVRREGAPPEEAQAARQAPALRRRARPHRLHEHRPERLRSPARAGDHRRRRPDSQAAHRGVRPGLGRRASLGRARSPGRRRTRTTASCPHDPNFVHE